LEGKHKVDSVRNWGGIIDVKAIGVLVYNKNDSLSLRFIKITSFVLMYIYVKIDVYPVKNCT